MDYIPDNLTLGQWIPLWMTAYKQGTIKGTSYHQLELLARLIPEELKKMVSSIRNIEKALGSAEKVVSPSEAENIAVARKSIVAAKKIKEGEIFSENNLTVKRPGTGISPMRWDEMMGKRASRNYEEDEMIEE